MRLSYLSLFVLILFASSCNALRSDESHLKGNAEIATNHTERKSNNKNGTSGDDTANLTEHHSAETTRGAKILDAQNEERGNIFKFKNLLRKKHVSKTFLRENLASDTLKTFSQKNLAPDTLMTVVQKNPASSRIVGALGSTHPKLTQKDVSFFKNNAEFGKLRTIFAKNPAQLTKKDVQLMQQSPCLSRAKSMLGKDPSKATGKNFQRVGTYLSKSRGNPEKYWDIFYGLICLAVLGVILSIAFVGL